MTALAKQEQSEVQVREPTPVSESAALMSMIERAARDPSVDLDRMERLYTMHERALARQAKAAFDASLAEMQPELPTIDRKGKIVILDKNDRKTVTQETPYARWEDINDAIRPVLKEHGFAISFRTTTASDGKLVVTCILSHRDGHREETSLPLMHDSSGSKNNVQAIGSSVSYGKRYTAMAMLNITSHAPMDRDDDGRAAGADAAISDEQVEGLQRLIVEVDADLPRFLKFMKIERLTDLPASRIGAAIQALEAKRK